MKERMKWFEDARFGMFIHWGVYASAARGEWVRSDEQMTEEAYQEYVDRFDPQDCDMREWARLAREAGMKYAVFTAKHHDGFCMFDSRHTDYSSMKYCGRDFVREFAEAFRKEGIRVGLYYSLLDWHHPDYPHYGDRHHPERNNVKDKDADDLDSYLQYMHAQVRELCTQYGEISVLWTDFSYDDMTAETWHGRELVQMVRSLQPGIILNNRLEASGEGFGSLVSGSPRITSGDFVSPEQIIPPGGIVDVNGNHVPWEACVTMNNHWGYCAQDHYFKPAAMLVRKLVECVSKGGNLLLNVGPDENGKIPAESIQALKEIGAWMKDSSDSIYSCSFTDVPKPEYGRITQKPGHVYYHVFDMQVGGIPLYGLKKEQIQKIILLKGKQEIPLKEDWITGNYPDLVFADTGPDPVLPDAADTVLDVVLKEKMILFLAIQLDEESKDALQGVMEEYAHNGITGRYVSRDNLHLTLAYLGEADPETVTDVMAKIDFEPFEIEITQTRHIGSLVMMDVAENKALDELAQKVRESLDAAGIAFDGKPFMSHITLVRKASGFLACQVRQNMTVSSFTLLASAQKDGRRVYTPVWQMER
ncbi:MAG: RNA 2',3'-cyclic phosphodiesterase [Solobacterium sp.]|nr:RNA 2',3'-cyclic phosphodiesterase [Solobacterium sp.]